MTSSPRTMISPSSAMRTSQFFTGTPTVSRRMPTLGRLQLITGPASVWPYPWTKVIPSDWKKMPTSGLSGAPLNPEVGIFFQSLGITFVQGYGQTEAGPVISCNRPSVGIRLETVGVPVKNTEVRIADDGEIMVRGELVMHGYWRNPEETARVLRDGWLATGDIGHLDEKGRIVITDRKKDLIVNDKGDNVSPQRVQGMLTLQPEIAQAMVYGDRRPHLVALLVPDPEIASATDLHARLQPAVDRVNTDLSVIERVRRFVLADAAFSIENEQLTPSLKIRRHVIAKVYGERLEALYPR